MTGEAPEVPASQGYVSDLIVELLGEAGIEHVAFNPGASFRGIHDSLAHRRGSGGPELALCLHEAVAVAVGQGYAKAAGRPMAVMLHDVVGLQNASMAIYNAWCDRVPLLLIGGTGPVSKARRRPWIDWIHTASVQAQLIRDYIKWDDEPRDAASVTESFARAVQTTRNAPGGPVYLCYDLTLQEDGLPEGFAREHLSAYPAATDPAPAAADLDRVAGLLRDARAPAIVAGYAGEDEEAFARLTALAEVLGAPVVDTGVRFALPTAHELNTTGVPGALSRADVVLVLDVDDPRGVLQEGVGAPDATVVNVTLGHLRLRGWAHDYQPLPTVALQLTATGDAAVEGLLSRLRADPPPADAVAARRREVAGRTSAQRAAWLRAASSASADGAVALDRLLHELGELLSHERFVLANATNQRLEHRLWDMDRPRQYLGWHAGGGLGYGLGAAIGAALARPGEIVVDVQADGDLMFTPSALWTMARLELGVLVVVNNNRQYRNTVEHGDRIARARGRDPEQRYVGATLGSPDIDFAGLARSQGVWAAGPVADPGEVRAALAEALDVVRGGRPALVDVLTAGA